LIIELALKLLAVQLMLQKLVVAELMAHGLLMVDLKLLIVELKPQKCQTRVFV
jgi:hypothetical protein